MNVKKKFQCQSHVNGDLCVKSLFAYVVAHIAVNIATQWSEMLKILVQWVRIRMRYAHNEHMLAVENLSVVWTNN